MKQYYLWLSIGLGFLSVHRLLVNKPIECGIRLSIFLFFMAFGSHRFFTFSFFELAGVIEGLGSMCLPGYPFSLTVIQKTMRLYL